MKVYIITGANKGLGEAFIDSILPQEGITVVSISRNITEKQSKYLDNGKLIFIEQDLSRTIDYSRLEILASIINNNVKVIFINNAGTIEPLEKVADLSDHDIVNALQVNVVSPIFIIKYLLQQFKNVNIQFVNITSGAANRSISNWSIYSSSKAFINRFFEILIEEHKNNKNFSFKSIDPGLIDTAMQAKIRSADFPLKYVFEDAQHKGELNSPLVVAERILKQLL